MYGIACGEAPVTKDDPLGTLKDGVVDREYLIDDAKQRIECWLDSVAAVDGNIAMQYFLEHFCVGNQTLAVACAFRTDASPAANGPLPGYGYIGDLKRNWLLPTALGVSGPAVCDPGETPRALLDGQ